MSRRRSFHRIKVNMPVKDSSKVKVEFQEDVRRNRSERKHESDFNEHRSSRATRSWNRNATHANHFHTSVRSLRVRSAMPVPRNGHISESQSDDDEDEGIFNNMDRPRRLRETRMVVTPGEPVATTSRNHTNSTERSSLVDSQEGIRRSTRQRKLKYDNYSDSWITTAQTLRGYPMYNSNENYSQELSEQASRSPKQPDETEDGETEDNEEVEVKKRPVLERPRRNLRKVKEQEEEEEEDDDDSDKQKNDTTENKEETSNGQGMFEDMYSRVKSRRPRQATTRVIAYNLPTRSSLRQRNRRMDAGSSGEDSSSSSEREEEEVEEKRRVSRRIVGRTRETRSVDVVMTESQSGIKYHLRKTKPVVKPFQLQPAPPSRRPSRVLRVLCDTVRRRRRRRSSSSSSSSSSSAMERSKVTGRGRTTSRKARKGLLDKSLRSGGASGKHIDGKTGLVHGKSGRLADIDPVTLDTSIRFEHVGGLENHVRCLQEMVVFPMLYTEVFKKFNVKPPKGVLFHGPPGTGKTLLARALANECSQGQRKVSFFMRKGADCLCKWVGESERQLRLLFEQAYEMRPSIIFFDELDGLAPVRSSKQDQIHASIVSTLLALMDGLTDRGEIIVIGATNRIDSIDPALRRPGRFDRELYFPLPAKKERQEILRIHVDKWEQAPSAELLDYLAEQTSGYCGSDLRSLCSEAVIQALRRRYPQIYKSSLKLLLNPDNVKVEKADFEKALQGIVSASSRVAIKPGRRLPAFIEPLLRTSLDELIRHTQKIFPHCANQEVIRLVHSPRLLITGSKVQISLLTSALLYHIEHCPVHTLDVSSLFSISARAPEESIVQAFTEMRRLLPCVLFIPEITEFWDVVQPSVKAVLLSQIYNLDCTLPILIVATSSSKKISLEIRKLFNSYQGDIFATSNPDSKSRENFFRPLLLERALKPPPKPKFEAEPLEELPVAPPPSPPKLTESQLKDLYDKEENTLRELRIFLRQICTKLANNKQFFMFTKPVDIEEVPDYLQIIQEPMDLETMMTKIDLHRYTCAQDFLSDIDLLVRNALEYNPDRDPADKLVRHRACYLRDTAYALIKAEMDSDFEEQCKSIRSARSDREKGQTSVQVAESFVPEFVHTKPATETHPALAPSWYQKENSSNRKEDGPSSSQTNTDSANFGRRRKRRTSLWAKGIAAKKKKMVKPEVSTNGTEEHSPEATPTKKLSGSLTNLSKKGSCSPTSPSVSVVENSPGTPARYPTKAERKEQCQMATSTPIHITHRTRSASREQSHADKTTGEPMTNGYAGTSEEEDAKDNTKEDKTVVELDNSALISDGSSDECQSPILLKKEVNIITVSKTSLSLLLSEVVQVTDGVESIEPLIYLYSQFRKIIGRYLKKTDRTHLVDDLQEELKRFVRFFVTREEDPDLNLEESVCTILEASTATQRQ